MNFTKGQLVEYERQAGKPPVIAKMIASRGDISTVSPLFVLGDDNSVTFELRGRSTLLIETKLLKLARKICEEAPQMSPADMENPMGAHRGDK